MQLAREEQGRADVMTKGDALRRMNNVLRAHCDYKDYPEPVFVAEDAKRFYETLGVELTAEELATLKAETCKWAEVRKKHGLKAPETGRWMFGTGGVSENFRERVRLCVAEAGRALPDYPKGTDPEDFWLHRLYLDLLKNNSDSLFCASKEGGMILSVCVASATFCARLERQAIQQSEPGSTTADRLLTNGKQTRSVYVQNTGETARTESKRTRRKLDRNDPEVAKRVALVRSNPGMPAAEMCEIFDRAGVPLPLKWQERGFKTWSRAYRDSNYRSRIDSLISKDRAR